MSSPVRERLVDLLREHGRVVCSTPGSLRLLLRQACPDGGTDVEDLVRSLDVPAVRGMLAKPVEVADGAGVTEALAASGMPAERARWVAESWLEALDGEQIAGAAPGRDWNEWNRLDVSAETAGATGSHERSIWHMALVAAGGAAGGIGPALGIFARGEDWLIEPWREAFDGLSFGAGVAALAVLGALGGLAGGVVGWAVGGGRSWTYVAWGGTSLGRLGLATFGAFNGASIGVLASLGFAGLYGVLPFALLGAGLGSFLGLLAAEQISRMF